MFSYENLDLYQILKMKFERFNPWNKDKFVDLRSISLIQDRDTKLHGEFYKIPRENSTILMKNFTKILQNST